MRPNELQADDRALSVVSLCAGIGGIDLAFARMGIPTRAAVEIDAHARGVLADRFPDTTLFRDLTEVSADDLRAAGVVPERTIVCAGWPCQGNSIAGRRRGLADPRSGLWLHVARLLAELRPRWFVGENVPGLLSVNHGRDFATVLDDLAGLGMEFAWRVLDARHFGVPQRRRRLIVVGHLGDQRGAPARVLLEPDCLYGDLAPGREARSTAPTGAREGIARPVAVGQIGQCQGSNVGDLGALRAGSGSVSGGVPFVTTVLGDHTHTLTADGHDASDDGTGRGTPVIGFAWQAGGNNTAAGALEYDATPTLPKSQTMAVAYTPHVAHSLMSHGGNDKHDPTMVTYVAQHASALLAAGGDRGHRLDAEMAAGGHLIVQPDIEPGITPDTEPDVIVRRLTPLECERLQGLPDGWTATSKGKPQSDSQRYQQLGNTVAVPVLEWIADRIASIDDLRVGKAVAA